MRAAVTEAFVPELRTDGLAGARARFFQRPPKLLVGLTFLIAAVPGTVLVEDLVAALAAGRY